MSKRAAKIVSRGYIRKKAKNLRKYLYDHFGFPEKGFLDPLKVLDALCQIDFHDCEHREVDYEIVDDSVAFIPSGSEAYTDYDEAKIYIRQRIVNEIQEGKYGRNIYTIYHEIGHLLLHVLAKDGSHLVPDDYVFSTEMEDPEKQADLFGAEMSMPADEVRGISWFEIVQIYRVSSGAAQNRKKELGVFT